MREKLFYIVALALLVGGIFFWSADLLSDPPMHYSGLGQSLSTDPAQYSYHAKNKVLFDQFEPFGYERWSVYQHSIISLVSYLWFSVAGPGLASSAQVGIIISFLTLLFFLLALSRKNRPWVLAAVAFCYIINVTLFTYGQLTYLENGLLLIGSLMYWVYSWYGDRTFGLIISGALAVAAVLTGKLFGLLLLPALALSIIFESDNKPIRSLSLMISGFVAFGIILITTLYWGNLSAVSGYLGEQTYGLRGWPEGLSSPWGFAEHLISYGYQNRLFYLDPDMLLFLISSIFLLVLLFATGRRFQNLPRATKLTLLWTAFGFLGLMPLNYSPLRYSLLFLPAIIASVFSLFDIVIQQKKINKFELSRISLSLVLFSFWILFFHTIGNLFFFNYQPFPTRTIVWMTLPVAILMTWLFAKYSDRIFKLFSKKVLISIVFSLLIFSAVANGFRIRRAHYLEENFNIAEANNDMRAVLGENAVISGPYAPILTIDNEIKSFIHLFGVSNLDSTLFDRYPITHLAVDASNWREAVKQFPQLSKADAITVYWIRDHEIMIYNISQIFSNQEANNYQKSDYEIAVNLFKTNLDSALVIAEKVVAEYPDSKSSTILLIDLLTSKGEIERARQLLTVLADKFPTDFFIQMQTGRLYQILSINRKDNSLHNVSQRYYQRASLANRYKTDYARKVYEQTAQQLSGSKP